MRGKHHIIVESPRLKYEFDIKRNITIIQGDSGTGKTTLTDLIREYEMRGSMSPVKIESDVPCVVYSGAENNWKIFLQAMGPSIIFIDEGYGFISSKEFAEMIRETEHYYVLITRKPLTCLPYSIKEVYGIRTTGKYHFPDQVYHEFYPIYSDDLEADQGKTVYFVTEDSKSGYQFVKEWCGGSVSCISADGNSNIYETIRTIPKDNGLIVMADGAAFGAYIAKVLFLAKIRNNLLLYLPESFEWVVLKSGILQSKKLKDVLEKPEDYIDSKQYFSWERFFTAYLEELTEDDPVRHYQKQKLGEFYLEGKNQKQIISVFPEMIQKIVLKGK